MGGPNPLAKWLGPRWRSKDRSAFVDYRKPSRNDSPTFASDSNMSNAEPAVSKVLDDSLFEEQRGPSEQETPANASEISMETPANASEISMDARSVNSIQRNFAVSVIPTSETPGNSRTGFTPIQLDTNQDAQILKNRDVEILDDSISTDSGELVPLDRRDERDRSRSSSTFSLFAAFERIQCFLFSCSCENEEEDAESHSFDLRTSDSRSLML